MSWVRFEGRRWLEPNETFGCRRTVPLRQGDRHFSIFTYVSVRFDRNHLLKFCSVATSTLVCTLSPDFGPLGVPDLQAVSIYIVVRHLPAN